MAQQTKEDLDMNDQLLKGLQLSVPTGGWVTPLLFKQETIDILGKWLTEEQIERLRGRAESSKQMSQDDQENPTLGDQRLVLMKASELALALATILEQAPSTAEGELDLIFHKYVGGIEQKDKMGIKLKMLALGLDASLQKLPTQGRRKSHAHFVSLIADVLKDAGIDPSVSENSRFYRICKAVFEAAGIYTSPIASIKVFIGK